MICGRAQYTGATTGTLTQDSVYPILAINAGGPPALTVASDGGVPVSFLADNGDWAILDLYTMVKVI